MTQTEPQVGSQAGSRTGSQTEPRTRTGAKAGAQAGAQAATWAEARAGAQAGPVADVVAAAFERRVGPGLALAEDAERIARACHDMAVRFSRGGKVVTFGNGGPATDARHLAVEFVHPVTVGKRALPAISLTNDAPTLTGLAEGAGYDEVFAAQLRLLGRPDDIAVGISADGRSRNVLRALEAARQAGMLTIALVGGDGGEIAAGGVADHVIPARTGDPLIVKEVHVTAYHVLWELVHVFLEQPGLLATGTVARPQAGPATAPGTATASGAAKPGSGTAPGTVTPGTATASGTAKPGTAMASGAGTAPGPIVAPGTGTAPGTGAPPAPAAPCLGDTCVTCADEAVPARVVELRDAGLALVDTGAGHEEISVALVGARVGDVVLVHAREAIAVLGADAPVQGHDATAAEGSGVEALYPFLYAGADAGTGAGGLDAVVAEVTRSTVEKAREVVELRRAVVERDGARLAACADAMARAFGGGGRLHAFGNGGSSTDASAVVELFLNPGRAHVPGAPGLPAIALTGDIALLTALANDVGFEVVFARQLAAAGRPGDIAMGLSTSGGSANVLRGFEEAKRRGMVTVGLAGYGGGRMAEAGTVDHLFTIPSASVHRIQEAQATVYHVLWELTVRALALGA